MSATAWAWLVLLFPLLGSIAIGLGFRVLPAKAAGAIGTLAIALAFACGVGALLSLLGESPTPATTPPRSGTTPAPPASTSSSGSTSTRSRSSWSWS